MTLTFRISTSYSPSSVPRATISYRIARAPGSSSELRDRHIRRQGPQRPGDPAPRGERPRQAGQVDRVSLVQRYRLLPRLDHAEPSLLHRQRLIEQEVPREVLEHEPDAVLMVEVVVAVSYSHLTLPTIYTV